MSNNKDSIGWLSVSGNPFEIGHKMGEQGRAAVHTRLIQSKIWK